MERLHHADIHQQQLKLKPTTIDTTKLKHNQTTPQPQDAGALNSRSNQQETRTTRRVTAAEQAHAQCAVEEDPANPNPIATSRQKPAATAAVVVLRRCEDLHIRTSGFQKIEEDSQRRPIDLRRQHKLQQQQQQRA